MISMISEAVFKVCNKWMKRMRFTTQNESLQLVKKIKSINVWRVSMVNLRKFKKNYSLLLSCLADSCLALSISAARPHFKTAVGTCLRR